MKNALFQFPTGAKAHTWQKARTDTCKQLHTKFEQPKKFLILARKIYTTRIGELHFLSIFSLHPDKSKTNGLHR